MPDVITGIKFTRTVRIAMRDGIELAASITAPEGEGPFPALMGYTPYHNLSSPEPPRSHRYFAERGYVVVQFDARGTGNSSGSTEDMYSADEIRDGCDMVEWIASQPWCNGNVGMWGISYGGVVGWQVAMHAPPHLKAVIVRSGGDDVYTEWTYPGGCLRPYIVENYAPLMTAYNFAPPDPEVCGEKWAEIWKEHLEKNVPWGIGYLSHQLDGPYWRDRSVRPGYDRVKCPVFVIGGWADWYPTALLRAFAHLEVPKRALIGPWSHYWPEEAIPGPRIDGLRECERWFDQWLKGTDTGVLDEPPVTVYVREYSPPVTMYMEDKGFWRRENQWPLARTQLTPMYLHPGEQLRPEPCGSDEAECDEYVYDPTVGVAAGKHGAGAFPPFGMPTDQRPDEALSLTYTMPPLGQDLEVTGNPLAVLYVSSTADVAFFCVKVCDVGPDGTSRMVTKGGLNATHRNSHTAPEPLTPGEVYELTIELLSMAYLFRAGHRIRVDVASADVLNAWPVSKPAVNTIHRSERYPSCVILPVAPTQDPKLPEPDLKPSPHPLPSPESMAKPEFTATHDIISRTLTASYTCRSGDGVNRASLTVSPERPAEAVVKSKYKYTADHPGAKTVVEADCVTSSDEAAFRHVVDVDITVNGKPHFNKSWTVSVAREGS